MTNPRINDLTSLHPRFRGVTRRIYHLAPTLASDEEAVQTFKDSKEAQTLIAEIHDKQRNLHQNEAWLKDNAIVTDGAKSISLNYDLLKLFIYGVIFCLGTCGEFLFLARFLHDLRFEGALSYLVAAVILSANCVILHFALNPDPRAKDAAEVAYRRERFVIFLALSLLLVSTLCLGLARALVIAKTLTEDASKQVALAATALHFSNFGFTLLPFGFALSMGILFVSLLQRIGLLFVKQKLVQGNRARKTVEATKAELATLYAQCDAGCHIAVLAYREGKAAGNNVGDDNGASMYERLRGLWKGISPEVIAALLAATVFCSLVFLFLRK